MGIAKILVADDDKAIAGAIEKLLVMEGYEVVKAYNGMEALDALVSNNVQLIILDIMMPKLDGLSTMMKIRDSKNIPIILLSAKSEDSDKILGLSMGADDYITKPFNPQELVARVKSQLRRYLQLGDKDSNNSTSKIVIGGLCMDVEKVELTVDGEPVKLTAKEFKILEFLMKNAGTVFSVSKFMKRYGRKMLILLNTLDGSY